MAKYSCRLFRIFGGLTTLYTYVAQRQRTCLCPLLRHYGAGDKYIKQKQVRENFYMCNFKVKDMITMG